MEASDSRLRFHLARALLQLNQLASLIPFFETNDELPMTNTSRRDRGLFTWVPPADAMLPIGSSTPSLTTHGGLPPSMVTNPEPHLRPILTDPSERGLSNSRGRQNNPRVDTLVRGTASSSGDAIPIAAPRAPKRCRTDPSPPAAPERPPSGVPDIDPSSTSASHHPVTPRAPLPIPSDDEGVSDSAGEHSPPASGENPAPTPTPTPPTHPSGHIPRLGHGIRGWALVDDNELIAYKKDTKSRHSWKVIGSKLHRDPESCRARWLWLKSSRADLSTPGVDNEE